MKKQLIKIKKNLAGKNKNQKNYSHQYNQFVQVIKNNKIRKIKQFAKTTVIDYKPSCPTGGFIKLPIHYAVETGNLDIVKVLIDNGANINEPIIRAWDAIYRGVIPMQPLDYAQENKFKDIEKYLLKMGAKRGKLDDIAPNLKNKKEIIYCNNCGEELHKENRVTETVCSNCGVKRYDLQDKMICKTLVDFPCGHVSPGYFCLYCGIPFNSNNRRGEKNEK